MAANAALAFDILTKYHDRGVKQAERDFAGFGSKMKTFGGIALKAIGVAAAGGVATLGAAFVKGTKDAAAYEVLAKKTAAVIKSTGNVANISVGGVQKLAGTLENLSGVDEDLIINSENVLATFTRVRNETGKGNDIFNQATKAALNMSVALGTDLQSSTIQLGKALNDPIRGITALQRVGVSFTQKQKDLIARMVEAGDVMGAQKLILEELQTEFGGAAKAAGDTFTGKIARAKDAIGDMARDIAAKALPKLGALADWVTKTGVPKFQEFITFVGQDFVPGVVAGLADFKTKVEEALPAIDFSKISGNLLNEAKGWASTLIGGLQLGLETGDWSVLGSTIGKGLVAAAKNAGTFLGDVAKKIGELLGKVDWVGVGISVGKQAIGFFAGFVLGILTFDFGKLISDLGKHWQELLFAALALALAPVKFIGWIGQLLAKIPFVGKFLAWLVEGLASMARAIVRPVLRFLGRFFGAFVEGLTGGAAAKALSAFGKWLSLIPTRIGLAAITIAEAAKRMIGKLGDAIMRMAGFIGRVIGNVISWLTTPFRRAGSWLVDRGKQLVAGLKDGIINIARTIGGWIKNNVIDRVTGRFAAARDWLFNRGSQIISGLRAGIVNAMRNIGDWIKRNIIDPIVGAVKRFFGIKSPSSVFAGIGGNLVAGLMRGLASGGGGVAIAKKIFGDLPSALGAIVSKGLVAIASLPSKALAALGRLGGAFAGLFGGGGGAKGGTFGSGVQRWAGLVSQVLAMLGQSQTWLPAVLRRMQRESGGNPRAINLWDINAQRGTPSIGLMQTIGPTFAAYAGPFVGRGIYDPLANIYAGLNYALHRYGSLAVMDRPGGYAMGGIISEPIFGVGRSGRTYTFGERGPETVTPGVGAMRLHPADIKAIGRVIAAEIVAAVGAGAYAAGHRSDLYSRAG